MKSLSPVAAFLLVLFLVGNIISTQSISPLYRDVVDGKKHETVEFLKIIKPLPSFPKILTMFQIAFGPEIKKQVFAEDLKLQKTIKNLEKILEKNPKAPQVLLELSKLYRDRGKEDLAQEYLRRAQEVDPIIK